MKNNDFEKLCKSEVIKYANEHLDKTDNIKIAEDNVFIVWSCKTLQNNKKPVQNTKNWGALIWKE